VSPLVRTVGAVLALAVTYVATPAGAVTIAEIVADGEAYNGQQVTVVGTVVDPRANYGGETMYNLSADDRRITVFAKGSAPASGDHLSVTAKVGWREGDEEFTWPPVLFESSHQPTP